MPKSIQLNHPQLNHLIDTSENIVILTGAGVSVASNIPDFKSFDTYAKQHNMTREMILNIEYFKREGEDFWVKYLEFFDLDALRQAQPNQMHEWIATLENKTNSLTVVTQNIDGLHTKAGNRHVIEMHGNGEEFVCIKCGERYTPAEINKQLEYFEQEDKYRLRYEAPKCLCGAVLKPDVVLFGEQVHGYENALERVKRADLLLVIGTRLQVSPVNTLVDKFLKERKKDRYRPEKKPTRHLVIWNNDATDYDGYAQLLMPHDFATYFDK